MNSYTAVVIHNIGIMSLTGFTLLFTDGNLWSLLVLLALYKTKKNEGDVE